MTHAYLAVSDSDEGLRGGLLVLDKKGVPEEFLYTERIQPSRLQQALYGPTLDEHVRTELIGRSLLERLDLSPEVLIVDDERMLDLGGSGLPTVVLNPSSHEPLGDAGDLEESGNGEYLFQATDYGSPLRLVTSDSDESGAERVTAPLVEAAEFCDLLEPLERVHKLLALVDEEKA